MHHRRFIQRAIHPSGGSHCAGMGRFALTDSGTFIGIWMPEPSPG